MDEDIELPVNLCYKARSGVFRIDETCVLIRMIPNERLMNFDVFTIYFHSSHFLHILLALKNICCYYISCSSGIWQMHSCNW